MARIVYKQGFEGQNKLECIEGIEIDLFNGQKALIYPKYAEKALLESEQLDGWKGPEETEIEALRVNNTFTKTLALLNAGSPAAKWVTQFGSDYDFFYLLPSLSAAMEIQYQKNDIDTLAETIKGADLLRNFIPFVWSCSQSNDYLSWAAFGEDGFAGQNSVYHSYLVVPTILINNE